MSNRNSKGIAIARRLTASTGIPGFTWSPSTGRITAPLHPYVFVVETAVGLERLGEKVRALPDGPAAVIRMNDHIPTYGDAWVTMRLLEFAPLLTAHYDMGHRAQKEGE